MVGVVTVKQVALKLSITSKSIMMMIIIIIIIIIIMYICHALIDAQSAHMIHFNLNAVLCTHVEQSPTQVT